MILFMLLLTGLLFAVLMFVAAMQPRRTLLSRFELNRRLALHDSQAQDEQLHERAYVDLVALQRALLAVLLLLFGFCAIAALGWLGVVVALIGGVFYNSLAHQSAVRRFAQSLYDRHATTLIQLTRRYPAVCRWLRGTFPVAEPPHSLASREELLHLVEGAGHVLTTDERHLIQHGMQFGERQVQEIMVPRSVVDTVNRTELLGPLALNDLHATGHSRFPVIDGDIDHVVGILHIQDLLTLGDKKSLTAEKAMERRVYYIRDVQTLQHALAAFLRTHHHLFVVVNQFHETAGVISLEDVIEALLGRQIIDEFDNHDDLRAVALRLARTDVSAAGSHTV
jgi:CBS domain containing-hemolysin-like protein